VVKSELRKIDISLMNGNLTTCQVNDKHAPFVEIVLHAANFQIDPFTVGGLMGPFIAMAILGCGGSGASLNRIFR
jgi:hypothetical protein